MRPGRLYLVDKIPRLPSSKLDLRALMAVDEANVHDERDHGYRHESSGEGIADAAVPSAQRLEKAHQC